MKEEITTAEILEAFDLEYPYAAGDDIVLVSIYFERSDFPKLLECLYNESLRGHRNEWARNTRIRILGELGVDEKGNLDSR